MPVTTQIPADTSVQSAVDWASTHARDIQAIVGSAGVMLIRGFRISSPVQFRSVCHAIEPNLRNYTGGDSPRTGLTDQVYTSTEYDASLEVFLHNELSYAGWSPRLVFFGCLIPALQGGETQVADGRQVYRSMPPGLLSRFESRGIAYLQHLWDADGKPGIGKSWQETFETYNKKTAEDYLEQSGMSWQWTEFGIRTRAEHPAVIRHPLSGEKCWRNQADQWHRDFGGVKMSFGDSDDLRFDSRTAGEATLGNHVTYGDGGEIDVEDIATIRQVTSALEVKFPWQAGDIMVIDNILAMHGRKPYRGPRQIIVAMA